MNSNMPHICLPTLMLLLVACEPFEEFHTDVDSDDSFAGQDIEREQGDSDSTSSHTSEAPHITSTTAALSTGVNGYQWWDITRSSVYELESRVRPTIMGNNTYLASGGWFNNGQGWYMGLQQKADGKRTLHAAIWDATGASASAFAQCSDFGGEGIGKKCWRYHNWPLIEWGHHTLRITRLEEDSQGRWWGFWVIQRDGTKLFIGKIRAETTATYIQNSGTADHYNFIENWSHGSYPTCNDVPNARYYVFWPRFNGGSTGSTRRHLSETHCVDANKYTWGSRLQIGL